MIPLSFGIALKDDYEGKIKEFIIGDW